MAYRITSYFGQKESFRSTGHSGIDFAMPQGTPLRAIRDGIIQVKDFGEKNAGKMIKIKGEDGRDYIYGHLSKFSVKEGQVINKGEIIGYSGNTGFSTGSHLHFGIKEGGRFIDPSPYISDIQNMNVKQFVRHIPKPSIPNEVVEPTQLKFTFFDYMKQHMDMIGNSLPDIKVNLISFFNLTDYSPFIQLLKNLVKLLFIHF